MRSFHLYCRRENSIDDLFQAKISDEVRTLADTSNASSARMTSSDCFVLLMEDATASTARIIFVVKKLELISTKLTKIKNLFKEYKVNTLIRYEI